MNRIEKIYQYKYLFVVLIFLLSSTSFTLAQVTIGSSLNPNAGSILDLKMYAPLNDGTTSTKGLLLPRVTLKKLQGKLAETLGASDTYENQEHIGLMVYHIDDLECPLTKSDIYVWDGSSWSGLSTQTSEDNYSYTEHIDGTGTVSDYEGHQYTTKRFRITLPDGTEYNQVWMTQNLRSLKNADGQWISCPEGIYLNPGYYGNPESIKIVTEVPDATIGTYTNAGTAVSGQTYDSFINDFGLTYAPEVAEKACPKGWHLPSQTEWENFLVALGGVKSGNNYQNIGNKMKANNGKTYVSVDNRTTTWGSQSATPNGFNAVPNGYIDPSTKRSVYFGYYTGFHGVKYVISIINTDLVGTSNTNTSLHYAIRCIKDTE